MTSKQLTATLSLATILVGAQAFADPMPVKRGQEIEALAGNCKIGPFEQTSKAGYYNQYCTQLTDAEKCLALVKQSFSGDTGETQPAYEPAKLGYCLSVFRNELIRN